MAYRTPKYFVMISFWVNQGVWWVATPFQSFNSSLIPIYDPLMEIEKLHVFILQTDHCPKHISPTRFLLFELMPERGDWIRGIFLSNLHREWKNIDPNTYSYGVSIAVPVLPDPLVFTIVTWPCLAN